MTNDRTQSVTKGLLRNEASITRVHLPCGPLLMCQSWSKSVLVWRGLLVSGFKLLNKRTSLNTADSKPSTFKDVLAIFQAEF